jgi:hypothetical protein
MSLTNVHSVSQAFDPKRGIKPVRVIMDTSHGLLMRGDDLPAGFKAKHQRPSYCRVNPKDPNLLIKRVSSFDGVTFSIVNQNDLKKGVTAREFKRVIRKLDEIVGSSKQARLLAYRDVIPQYYLFGTGESRPEFDYLLDVDTC